MSDDCIPATVHWDTVLVNSLQGWNFVSANDGWQAPARMGGCNVFSGNLIRAVGHIYPKGFTHLYTDDVWEEVGRETGCWLPRMDVLVRHEHEMLKGTYDETRKHVDKNYPNDHARFMKWRAEEKPAMLEAVRKLQAGSGVRMVKPDLTGVSVMIATPSHSGQYHSVYNVGLFNSMKMFGELGVPYANAYPRGGAFHSNNEWLAEESLGQLQTIVSQYVQAVADTKHPFKPKMAIAPRGTPRVDADTPVLV